MQHRIAAAPTLGVLVALAMVAALTSPASAATGTSDISKEAVASGWSSTNRPDVSSSGSKLAYSSLNLDTGFLEAWVYDAGKKTKTLASVNSGDEPLHVSDPSAVAISGNGRYVAFAAYLAKAPKNASDGYYFTGGLSAAGLSEVGLFVRDLEKSTTALVLPTPADPGYYTNIRWVDLDATARTIAFTALQVGPKSAWPGRHTVVTHDRSTGVTDVAHSESEDAVLAHVLSAVAVSGDGGSVVFTSLITDSPAGGAMVSRLRVVHESGGPGKTVDIAVPGVFGLDISYDGSRVTYLRYTTKASDVEGWGDTEIAVRDLDDDADELIIASGEAGIYVAGPALSGDGRALVFWTTNGVMSRLRQHDLDSGTDTVFAGISASWLAADSTSWAPSPLDVDAKAPYTVAWTAPTAGGFGASPATGDTVKLSYGIDTGP